MTQPRNQPDANNLPQWLPHKLARQKDRTDYKAAVEDNVLTLWTAAYPELRMHLPLTGNEKDAGRYDFAFLSFKEELAEHQKMMRSLEQKHFTIKRVPVDSPIDLILQPPGHNAQELTHLIREDEKLKPFLINAKTNFTAKSEPDNSLSARLAAAFNDPDQFRAEMAEKDNTRPGKLPDHKKPTIVISDPEVIKRLASPRNYQDRTWLDLLLASGANIAIPSYAIDVKLLGRSVKEDDKGKYSFYQFDPNYVSPPAGNKIYQHIAAVKAFADKATRIHIDKEGNTHSPSNPAAESHIFIYDNFDDHEVTDRMLKFGNAKQVLADLEGKARGKASDMIGLALAARAPFKGPVYVVSHNTDWYAEVLNRQNITTKAGHPIGYASLAGYVNAELFANSQAIQEELRHRGIPANGAITLERVRRNIAAAFGVPDADFSKSDRALMVQGKIRQAGGPPLQGERLEDLLRGLSPEADKREAIAAEKARVLEEQPQASSKGLAQQPHPPEPPKIMQIDKSQDIFSHAFDAPVAEKPHAPVAEKTAASANAAASPVTEPKWVEREKIRVVKKPKQTPVKKEVAQPVKVDASILALVEKQSSMKELFKRPDGSYFTDEEIIAAVPKQYSQPAPLSKDDISQLLGGSLPGKDIAVLNTAAARMEFAIEALLGKKAAKEFCSKSQPFIRQVQNQIKKEQGAATKGLA